MVVESRVTFTDSLFGLEWPADSDDGNGLVELGSKGVSNFLPATQSRLLEALLRKQ